MISVERFIQIVRKMLPAGIYQTRSTLHPGRQPGECTIRFLVRLSINEQLEWEVMYDPKLESPEDSLRFAKGVADNITEAYWLHMSAEYYE